MSNLEIAIKLREQIKEQWPYVSTILALYANNTDGKFTERIQDMVSKLLFDEVFYIELYWHKDKYILLDVVKVQNFNAEIKSLPINQVLFSSEDNMFGHLK
jgi:hypothetical protein